MMCCIFEAQDYVYIIGKYTPYNDKTSTVYCQESTYVICYI